MSFDFQIPGQGDILSQFLGPERGGVAGTPRGRPVGAQTINPFTQLSMRSGGSAGGTLANRVGIGAGDPNSMRLLDVENASAAMIRDSQNTKARVDAVVERVARLQGLAGALQSFVGLTDAANAGNATQALAALRGAAGGVFSTSFDIGTIMQASTSERVRRMGSRVVGVGLGGFLGFMVGDQLIQTVEAGVNLDIQRQNTLTATQDIAGGAFGLTSRFTSSIDSQARGSVSGLALVSDAIQRVVDANATSFTQPFLFGEGSRKFQSGMAARALGILHSVTGTTSVADEKIKILKQTNERLRPALKSLVSDPVLLASVVDPSKMDSLMTEKDPDKLLGSTMGLVNQLYLESLTPLDRERKLNRRADNLRTYKENLKEDQQLFLKKQRRWATTSNLSLKTNSTPVFVP